MAGKKGTSKKKTETQSADESKVKDTQTETEVTEPETETPTPPETVEEKDTSSEEQAPPPAEKDVKEEDVVQESDAGSRLGDKLDAYIEAMAPNKMVESSDIQNNQMRLRSVINLLLATPDESFNDAMKTVVKKIRSARKGAFSERLIFRGFPQIKIARSERQKLETLITLLLATADAQQPGKVKEVVDMNVVYRYVKNDDQQQKLQSYYGG